MNNEYIIMNVYFLNCVAFRPNQDVSMASMYAGLGSIFEQF